MLNPCLKPHIYGILSFDYVTLLHFSITITIDSHFGKRSISSYKFLFASIVKNGTYASCP